MGRKPLPKKKQRAGSLKIRFTPEERKILDAKAKAANLPLGTWLRQLGLNS